LFRRLHSLALPLNPFIEFISAMASHAVLDEKAEAERQQLETAPPPLDEKLTGAVLDEYAQNGVKTEHEMTPWEAVKSHPMAVFWCLMVSMVRH
jgi:hypothetical protein